MKPGKPTTPTSTENEMKLTDRIKYEMKASGGDLDRAILRAVGTVREYVVGDDWEEDRKSAYADAMLCADITASRAGDASAWERATNGGEYPLLRA